MRKAAVSPAALVLQYRSVLQHQIHELDAAVMPGTRAVVGQEQTTLCHSAPDFVDSLDWDVRHGLRSLPPSQAVVVEPQ